MQTVVEKGDNVLIRTEFVVRRKEPPVPALVGKDDESTEPPLAGSEEVQEVGAKRRLDARDSDRNDHKKIALKNRHQSPHPNKEDRLCSFAAKGNPCPFTKDCCYSHNIMDYLSKKEPDLGPVCYQFETFGLCANGIMCRFGSGHINTNTGVNLTRPAELGGVIERIQINVLSKEAQTMLRKKKYNRGVDRYVVRKKGNQYKKEDATTAAGATTTAAATAFGSTEAKVEPDNNGTPPGGDTVMETAVPTVDEDKSAAKDEAESCAPAAAPASAPAKREDYSLKAFPERTVKLVDFSHKVYIAPLTTVGNLPFRRILKEYGADITCGEMAMANNIVAGQASEWALMRRHSSEDCFGVQVAGGYADTMSLTSRDLNSACPIDLVCNRGCGSALMTKSNRLFEILDAMTAQMPSRSVTIKIRTGWNEKSPIAHELIPQIQRRFNSNLSAIMLHGRSRLQRYHKLANWDYILQAAQAQDPSARRIPVIGNGDILSWEDWQGHQHLLEENMHRVAAQAGEVAPNAAGATVDEVEGDKSELLGLCSCAMLARGALIKPWLPQEIKEQRVIDIPATERLDILRKYCNYGLEHWGSDQQGVNNTRRFLLEWMSFLHRYVPAGILAQPYAQGMNQRPPQYFGRGDLETLLSSPASADWIKVSEMFLGPVPADYAFIPKHKSNSYAPEAEHLPEG